MARFRLELGPVPMHHQVYLHLKAALDSGEIAPGDRLPPERELCVRYSCSLITIRRALSELAREGRLERTRGRGTFALKPRIERDFADTRSFSEEMQRRGLDPETRLVAARPESAGEVVARALDLEVGSPIVYVERLRVASRGTAPARAGPPAGRAVSRPPGLRPRAQLAVRRPDRAVRHAHCARPRIARTRAAANARGAAARTSPREPPRSSSKASPSTRTANPSNSPGRSSAATEPATTSSASWCARTARAAVSRRSWPAASGTTGRLVASRTHRRRSDRCEPCEPPGCSSCWPSAPSW